MRWCDLPRGHRRAPPQRETGLGRPPTATKPTYACAHTRTHTHKAPVRTREAHAKARVHARKHAHTHTQGAIHGAFTHMHVCTMHTRTCTRVPDHTRRMSLHTDALTRHAYTAFTDAHTLTRVHTRHAHLYTGTRTQARTYLCTRVRMHNTLVRAHAYTLH